MSFTKRIIGVDPGSGHTGIGIIDSRGNRLKYVYSEIITTVKNKKLDDKLHRIFVRISEIVRKYRPEVASIEKIFSSVNPHSSLILGHARGVSMLAARMSGLEIEEYTPGQIKSAVTGIGRASKDQVAAMIKILLNLDRDRKMTEDESDALAAAICHANTIDYSRVEKMKIL